MPSTALEGAVKMICTWQLGVHTAVVGLYVTVTPELPIDPVTLKVTALAVPVRTLMAALVFTDAPPRTTIPDEELKPML